MFADIRTEWRVAEIESKLQQKVGRDEISEMRSLMASMERTMREVSTEVDGLRDRCDACDTELQLLRNELSDLQTLASSVDSTTLSPRTQAK